MRSILFFLHLLPATIVYAQPTIQWQKCYGGTAMDDGFEIATTADGGYIFASTASSSNGDINNNHGDADVWVTKINSTGTISWQKSYGGTATEEGLSIRQTSDGGYIVAGTTMSNNGDINGALHSPGWSDVWVLKLDASGNINWRKCYGGTYLESGNVTIRPTQGGGYIFMANSLSNDGDLSGCSGSGCWVVKLDDTGLILWKNCYGGNFGGFEETNDGGYIVAGAISGTGYGGSDCRLIKLTSGGTKSWEKNYGGSDDENATYVHQCKDGGYIFTAYTKSNDHDISGLHAQNPPNNDIWVVKTDATGNIIWSKVFGGTEEDYAYHVLESDDGSYVITGGTESHDGDIVGSHNMGTGQADMVLMSFYQNGSQKWVKFLGGSRRDYGQYTMQTSDTGFLVIGGTNSVDGDVTNGGYHTASAYDHDVWVVKLSSVLSVDDINGSKLKVYPTITSGTVNVELPQGHESTTVHLFNLLGQEININTTSGLNRVIHIDNTPAGMYTLQLRNNGEVKNYKVVYQP